MADGDDDAQRLVQPGMHPERIARRQAECQRQVELAVTQQLSTAREPTTDTVTLMPGNRLLKLAR